MKTETILSADVLDIIFEHRNKSYGAYALRKFYNNRLYKALGMVFLFALLLCGLSFFSSDKKLPGSILVEEVEILRAPKNDRVPQKPKINEYHAPLKAAVKLNPGAHIVISKDSSVHAPINNIFGSTVVAIVAPGPTGDPGPEPIGMGQPLPVAPVAPVAAIDRNTPVNFVEQMPEFPGGAGALRKFLEKNLRNPTDMETGESILVKIRFVVGYDGVLKGFETVEDGGEAFNKEVVRVLKKMPQWNPGRTKGENVSVYYTLPVRFAGME